MHGHLVAVEIRVEPLAHQGMDQDGVALDEGRLESLDAHAVQRRRPVQQHGVLLDHLLEDVPDLLGLALEHLLGALDRVGQAELLQAPDDEGLVELQRDLLGQPALVQLELRPHRDHRARAVVHALAEEVLAETALLALDHVGEALERPTVRAHDGTAAAVVVEERVDRMLEHALLVADDHVGRVEVEQLLEAVVAVDQAAVQVVQVAGGEVAALQQHQRTQVGRNHGDDVVHHPGRVILGILDGLDDLQALDDLFLALLGPRGREFRPQLLAQLVEIQAPDQLPDGLGAHVHIEIGAPLLPGEAVILLGEELLLLEIGGAGVDDHVILVVDDPLQRGRFHVEQVAQARGHGLEEPDVHHGRGQSDVPHARPAHRRVRDLDAAAVAHDALVLDALVLPAEALPVPLGTEDALAEQAVLLGTVSAVVDGLGLRHLAVRPREYVVGRSQADVDRTHFVDFLAEDIRHVSPHSPRAFASLRSSRKSPRPRISWHSTSKEMGVPGSRVCMPLTMDS